MKIKTTKQILKSKSFWLLAVFWIFVGAASSGFYNIQTFITQVWFQDNTIFQSGSTVSQSANSIGATVIGAAGLIAAILGGPLVGWLIDKFKSYKKTIGALLGIYIISCIFIFGFITPTYLGANPSLILGLLIGIVTPILGICYGFRNPIDAYNTLYTEEKRIPLGFVAGIYAIGFGLAGYGLNYMIQWYSNGLDVGTNGGQVHNYLWFYLLYAGILAILLGYMLLFMPEPKRIITKKSSKEQIEQDKIETKKEIKSLFRNKNWWLGLFSFVIIIGFYIAIDIFYINILPKKPEFKFINGVKMIAKPSQVGWDSQIIRDVKGLFDLIRGPIMALTFMIASILIIKIGLKKAMALSAIAGICVALSIGLSIVDSKYNKWVIIIIPSLTTPILASLVVNASFTFMHLMTTRRIRATIMTIFNGLTYGVGGLIFGLVGPILFDVLGGMQKWNEKGFTSIRGAQGTSDFGQVGDYIKNKPPGTIGIDYVTGHWESGQGWITFIIMTIIILFSFITIMLLSKNIETKIVKEYRKKQK